jgi:integrase
LLAMTGLRLREVADAQWSEIRNGVLTIPARRMKGKNQKARDHAVPLTPDMLAIIEALPRFNQGQFMFSTTGGRKPTQMSGPLKRAVDTMMLADMRETAKERGDDPDAVKLEPWRNHDLRRNVRSGLSALKVDQRVAEAVLAHVPQGMVSTYDVHTFIDEKREALEKWGAHLKSIIEPPPANVIGFKARR